MLRLLAILGVLYAFSLVALLASGLWPNLPWSFLVLTLPCFLPLVFAVSSVGDWLQQRPWLTARRLPGICLPLGVILVLVYPVFLMLPVALLGWLVMLWDPQRSLRSIARPYALSVLTLVVALAVVWNGNYVAGRCLLPAAHDEVMMRTDLGVYGWLLGPVERSGLYPLWPSPVAFRLFENAYFLMFPEILLVLYLLLRARAEGTQFLASLFLCYSVGLAVFVVYPVVGPYYWAPESLDPTYHGSTTHRVMQKLVEEYAAVVRGEALNGYGYCVGLPSLHVGLALLMQVTLFRFRVYFWLLLPVNIMLVGATLVLGFHYILDVPGGILATCLVLTPQWLWKKWRDRTAARPLGGILEVAHP